MKTDKHTLTDDELIEKVHKQINWIITEGGDLYHGYLLTELCRRLKERAIGPTTAEELWDYYSEHIDEDITSLERVAGTAVMFKRDFLEAVKRIPSPPDTIHTK